MPQAPINKILPTSLVDGPGSRAAVFLQGCNIACAYCHNPETQNLCTGCGTCINTCPAHALSQTPAEEAGENSPQSLRWDDKLCVNCDACIAVCPHNASPKVQWMEAAAVHAKIMESVPFITGVTVSGGECTLYPAFLTSLFTLCRASGLHCLLDSNGTIPLAAHPALLAVCDGVMLDVKAWDDAVHQALTGAPNGTVKQNLALLAQAGKLAEVRIVCLPGEVDVEAAIGGIAQTLGPHTAATPLKLIRFRPFGVRGRLAQTPSPTTRQMDVWAQLARQNGFQHITVL